MTTQNAAAARGMAVFGDNSREGFLSRARLALERYADDSTEAAGINPRQERRLRAQQALDTYSDDSVTVVG